MCAFFTRPLTLSHPTRAIAVHWSCSVIRNLKPSSWHSNAYRKRPSMVRSNWHWSDINKLHRCVRRYRRLASSKTTTVFFYSSLVRTSMAHYRWANAILFPFPAVATPTSLHFTHNLGRWTPNRWTRCPLFAISYGTSPSVNSRRTKTCRTCKLKQVLVKIYLSLFTRGRH